MATDSLGNQKVDFAWGNLPMQPNTDRGPLPAGTNINFGGGYGDEGWSQTTQVKSDLLDLALDGHAITQQKWNGYPGYVPNVASLSLWEGTFAPYSQVGMNWNGALLTFETGELWVNGDTVGKQGYTIRLSSPVEDTTIDTLSTLVSNDSLIGQSVDGFTAYLNYMGMAATAAIPAGHIVAAATVDDYYGQTDILITVFTGTLVPQPDNMVGQSGTFTTSTQPIDFVIGAGNNKSIIFKGTNDVDFEALSAWYMGPDFVLEFSSISWMQDVTPLSEALKSVAQSDLSGALIGFAPTLSQYGGNPAGMNTNAAYSAYELASGTLIPNDGYGNPKVRLTTTVAEQSAMGMGSWWIGEYDPMMGDPLWTVYIVK